MSKLTKIARKFHNNEAGLEALQVVMILAVAAVALIAVKSQWENISAWFHDVMGQGTGSMMSWVKELVTATGIQANLQTNLRSSRLRRVASVAARHRVAFAATDQTANPNPLTIQSVGGKRWRTCERLWEVASGKS